MSNRFRNMELHRFWFKRGEKERLIDAVNGNFRDEAFDILFKMLERGDLR